MRYRTETALILAAGRGTRMRREAGGCNGLSPEARRFADRGLKGLIPVAGRPFLDYSVQRLVDTGVERICFVVSPGAGEIIRYGERVKEDYGISVGYARQNRPRGTADAVLAAEKEVGGGPFLLCNSDNIYPADALSKLYSLPPDTCGVAGFDRDMLLKQGNFGHDRISGFAVLRIGETGELLDILEKPQCPQEYECQGKLWVGMNLYRFTPEIFDFCRLVRPHPGRGELELTAAVSLLVRTGRSPCRVVFASGAVLDMTGRSDIISVREALEAAGES